MIIGKRVYLRAFDKKDVPIRVQWMNDPAFRTYLNNPFPVSEASTTNWLNKLISDPSRLDLMICVKDGDEPIGYTGYRDIDFVNGRAESYTGLGNKDYHGMGLAKESKILALKYIFNRYNINSVYAKMRPGNEASIGLNKSIGYQVDGVLRSHVYSHGAYRDMMVMSILRGEFFSKHGED
jgi:RimJ/RimL family protein N-acetyltransferase